MMKFIKFLQNPFLKIFGSPIAILLFGLVAGVSEADQIQWLSLGLLYIVITAAQLIDHLLYLQLNQLQAPHNLKTLWIVFEVILIAASIGFMIQQSWMINVLLLTYLAFIHVQYFPYNISDQLPQFILSIFFNSVVVNTIAYYSQTQNMPRHFLVSLIPILIFVIGVNMTIIQLRLKLKTDQANLLVNQANRIGFGICILALVIGIRYVLPSKSFMLVQIAYFVITTASLLPLLAGTHQASQAQNKINYTSAVHLIFSLLYSLAYLY